MIIATTKELHKLKIGSWTTSLFGNACEYHKILYHIKWFDEDKLKSSCETYIQSLNWNNDTALCLFAKPDTDIREENIPLEQLCLLNKTQCICWLMENMTLEKLADIINQTVKLRAFL